MAEELGAAKWDARPRQVNRHDRQDPLLTKAWFARAATVERQRSEAYIQALPSRAPHFNTQTAARDSDRLVGDPHAFLGAALADVAARYLINLSLPPDGTHCPL